MYRRSKFAGFDPDFSGDGAMLRGYLRERVWHARSKDGVDRLSLLPDELLSAIFTSARPDWPGAGPSERAPKPVHGVSRRLLPFTRQLQWHSPTIRCFFHFRHFVRIVLARPDLAARVRALQLIFAIPRVEWAVLFESGEERVAFWKALGGVEELDVRVPGQLLPTKEEVERFAEGELLGRLEGATVAVREEERWARRWNEPEEEPPRFEGLFALAPNLRALELVGCEKLLATGWAETDGPLAPVPSVQSVLLSGKLAQVSHQVVRLLHAFPRLSGLELVELTEAESLDPIVGSLNLPDLTHLTLTTTGAPHDRTDEEYFFDREPVDPPPPLTTTLTKFNELTHLTLTCSTEPWWLLSLPSSLRHFTATSACTISLPILSLLLSPASQHHLPALRSFRSNFLPPRLAHSTHAPGLRLGRAQVPYLPVLENGEPDFGLKALWHGGPEFRPGEWSWEAFDEAFGLAEAGGVDVSEGELFGPYLFEKMRREEVEVRAELKRKWEAGELVWRKDTKQVAWTSGHQQQTGLAPERKTRKKPKVDE